MLFLFIYRFVTLKIVKIVYSFFLNIYKTFNKEENKTATALDCSELDEYSNIHLEK
jgi:hypothetical protein